MRRGEPAAAMPGVIGSARPVRPGSGDAVDATRSVARRTEPGDVVVLDHLDLDRVSAESLLAARPGAVVNVRSSLSGRHPAGGAAVLVGAGITLVDDTGPALLAEVRDGERLRIHDGGVYQGERLLGQGRVLTAQSVEAARDQARVGMTSRLEGVGADAAAFFRTHEDVLLDGHGLPVPRLDMSGHVVLVVAPGDRAAAEVAALRPWIRDARPLVVAADSGAEVARTGRRRPALLVGDPGEETARRLSGVETIGSDQVPAGMSATELAVMLATAGGADLVVLAGAPASFDELLDRDRASAAALLAVRLRAGERVVDGPAVLALRRPAVGLGSALVLVLAGVAALVLAVLAVGGGDEVVHRLREAWPW
jgi:uncharacterized membrane-anchored protein